MHPDDQWVTRDQTEVRRSVPQTTHMGYVPEDAGFGGIEADPYLHSHGDVHAPRQVSPTCVHKQSVRDDEDRSERNGRRTDPSKRVWQGMAARRFAT